MNKMFESYQKEIMKGFEESGINDFVKSVIEEKCIFHEKLMFLNFPLISFDL